MGLEGSYISSLHEFGVFNASEFRVLGMKMDNERKMLFSCLCIQNWESTHVGLYDKDYGGGIL